MALGHRRLAGIAVVLLAATRPLAADKNPDDPNVRYKAAMARNDIEGAVAAMCDAAKADPKKYDKKCASAQQFAAEQLATYEPLYTAGKSEYGRRDYAGAARDLSKIFFGPHKDEAQKMLAQANFVNAHPQQLADSKQALAAAVAAYDRGDLAAAATNAHAITIPDMEPEAQRILTNIRTYEDTIKAADTAMASGNYTAAQQQYTFALKIRSNGPGDPAGKLQKITTLLAAANTPNAPQPQPTGGDKKLPAADTHKGDTAQPADIASKIKFALAEAHAYEAKKNPEAALAAYDRALTLDPHQAEALAARQKILDSLKKDIDGLETKLSAGIRSYYSSRLGEASDAISLYLNAGGMRHKGAAHFYLGATFAAKSLLAGAGADSGQNSLRQLALQEFQLAKREHYKPVERYVAPKILSVWNQSAS